jgi:surfeit locus 1 family protein
VWESCWHSACGKSSAATWKLDLIDRVEQRVHARCRRAGAWTRGVAGHQPPPMTSTGVSSSAAASCTTDETLVQALTVEGPGYWVLTPLQTADGTSCWSTAASCRRTAAIPRRAAGNPHGPAAVTGLLRISEPGGGFLRQQRSRGQPLVFA